jgi:hypothetical protein
MNTCLITGAILAVLISVVHSYLGERYILTRLFRRTELPHLFGSDRFTRQTLRFAWHLSSIAWIGLGGIMISFTYADPVQSRRVAIQILSFTFFIHAIITAFATRGRHLAWIVYLAIAIVCWLGVG